MKQITPILLILLSCMALGCKPGPLKTYTFNCGNRGVHTVRAERCSNDSGTFSAASQHVCYSGTIWQWDLVATFPIDCIKTVK